MPTGKTCLKGPLLQSGGLEGVRLLVYLDDTQNLILSTSKWQLIPWAAVSLLTHIESGHPAQMRVFT